MKHFAQKKKVTLKQVKQAIINMEYALNVKGPSIGVKQLKIVKGDELPVLDAKERKTMKIFEDELYAVCDVDLNWDSEGHYETYTCRFYSLRFLFERGWLKLGGTL